MDEIKLQVITKAIEDKKGEEVQIIETRGKSPFYDYVVIATINNYRQGGSIADEIEEKLALIKEEVNHVEGDSQGSEWILVDCGDIVVHLFTPSERLRVNLEELLLGRKNAYTRKADAE